MNPQEDYKDRRFAGLNAIKKREFFRLSIKVCIFPFFLNFDKTYD